MHVSWVGDTSLEAETDIGAISGIHTNVTLGQKRALHSANDLHFTKSNTRLLRACPPFQSWNAVACFLDVGILRDVSSQLSSVQKVGRCRTCCPNSGKLAGEETVCPPRLFEPQSAP